MGRGIPRPRHLLVNEAEKLHKKELGTKFHGSVFSFFSNVSILKVTFHSKCPLATLCESKPINCRAMLGWKSPVQSQMNNLISAACLSC